MGTFVQSRGDGTPNPRQTGQFIDQTSRGSHHPKCAIKPCREKDFRLSIAIGVDYHRDAAAPTIGVEMPRFRKPNGMPTHRNARERHQNSHQGLSCRHSAFRESPPQARRSSVQKQVAPFRILHLLSAIHHHDCGVRPESPHLGLPLPKPLPSMYIRNSTVFHVIPESADGWCGFICFVARQIPLIFCWKRPCLLL